MIVDCNDPNDVMELYALIEKAKEKNKKLKVVYDRKQHTDPQRKFLHFAMSYFAHCYGCTLTDVKEMHLKRYCLPEFFDSGKRDKGGNVVLRSTSELSDSEYSYVISNFLAYADINGIPIPKMDDTASIKWCQKQIDKTEMYGT